MMICGIIILILLFIFIRKLKIINYKFIISFHDYQLVKSRILYALHRYQRTNSGQSISLLNIKYPFLGFHSKQYTGWHARDNELIHSSSDWVPAKASIKREIGNWKKRWKDESLKEYLQIPQYPFFLACGSCSRNLGSWLSKSFLYE